MVLRPDGGAIYQTRDTIRGWLLPIVKLLYGRSLETGFREMAEALKGRVERLDRSVTHGGFEVRHPPGRFAPRER